MAYIHSLPTTASFTGKGLIGYIFGPLNQKDLEIFYVQVHKGHDTFMISRKITRTYYILSGTGHFTIENRRYDVGPGCLVEIPPKVEYCYSGTMTLIGLSRPRWFSGNDTHTRWNPDVVSRDSMRIVGGGWLTRLVRLRIFGKSPISAYLRVNQQLWNRLPLSLVNLRPVHLYAKFLHDVARIQGVRSQALSTYFLRNRPELELIRRLLDQKSKDETLTVAVLGCSTGAEAYSVAWTIRSARPDLKVVLHAVDISKEAVEVAKRGVYSVTTPQLTNTPVVERMTEAEMGEFFDKSDDSVTVKTWIREGIRWHIADVSEPLLIDTLGLQDLVVANNFLCHMDPDEQEMCLRNIARLVRPRGYLCVSGIDLDVRTKVARDLGLAPVEDLLEAVHEGDPGMRSQWPCHYGGLEPINKGRLDWRIRYAAVFQLAFSADCSKKVPTRERCALGIK